MACAALPALLCTCGDGVKDPGEQCDGTASCNQDCTQECVTAEDCGNTSDCFAAYACIGGRCRAPCLSPPVPLAKQAASATSSVYCLDCALQDSFCNVDGAPCELGVIECEDGQGVCVATGEQKDAGELCGVELFCTDAGECLGCPEAGVEICRDVTDPRLRR